MEITTLQIVLVFIVACIAGMGSILDEFQFHRPLIACTLVGIVLGDMKTGIIIGGTLEMIALGWMNIGAAVAPDAALASIISTILVIAGHQSIGAGIALAIPLAAAGQVLTIIVRTITVAFQHAADKAADNGNLTAISWIHVSSLFLQAMRVAIPAVIVALSVGTSEVQNMLNAIPEVVTNGLNIAGGMIVVVGYAMVINMMRAGYLMPFFYLGFVTAAFTNFNLVALGVIGTVMAVLYIQLSPKYNRVAGALFSIYFILLQVFTRTQSFNSFIQRRVGHEQLTERFRLTVNAESHHAGCFLRFIAGFQALQRGNHFLATNQFCRTGISMEFTMTREPHGDNARQNTKHQFQNRCNRKVDQRVAVALFTFITISAHKTRGKLRQNTGNKDNEGVHHALNQRHGDHITIGDVADFVSNYRLGFIRAHVLQQTGADSNQRGITARTGCKSVDVRRMVDSHLRHSDPRLTSLGCYSIDQPTFPFVTRLLDHFPANRS